MNIIWLLFIVAASATTGNTGGCAYWAGGVVMFCSTSLVSARDGKSTWRISLGDAAGLVIVLGRFLDGFRQLNRDCRRSYAHAVLDFYDLQHCRRDPLELRLESRDILIWAATFTASQLYSLNTGGHSTGSPGQF